MAMLADTAGQRSGPPRLLAEECDHPLAADPEDLGDAVQGEPLLAKRPGLGGPQPPAGVVEPLLHAPQELDLEGPVVDGDDLRVGETRGPGRPEDPGAPRQLARCCVVALQGFEEGVEGVEDVVLPGRAAGTGTPTDRLRGHGG